MRIGRLGLRLAGVPVASDSSLPPVGGYDLMIDADYVYSDASGTTLCSDGDTIASFMNRATGAIVLPESTGTNRPTYKAGPCFLADQSPAIRFDKSLSQWLRLSSYAYNKRAFTLIILGSNAPGEAYVGGVGVATSTWSLGNSDYYQGTNGVIGEWLFPTALADNSYRLQSPYCNIHVLGSSQRLQVQFHSEQDGAAVTAGTGTGLLIAARGSTPGTFGDLWTRAIIAYPRELSGAELHAVENWGLEKLGHLTSDHTIPLSVSRPVIVISGNSICAGSGATTPRGSTGSQLALLAKDYGYQLINAAIGGQSANTIDSDYDDQAGRYFTGRIDDRNIAVVWEIVNSVQYNEAANAAAYYAKLGSIADKARAAGADYVVGVTAPVQNWGGETALRLVNDELMKDTSNKFDRLVDCRQDEMGVYNASYFDDNYHPNDDGSERLANIIWRDGILPIIEPTADTFATRLHAYYKCDETSGDLIDYSGNGRNLPAVGSPGSATGKVGNGRSVGTTNRFESTDANWQPTNQDFSFSLWFKFGSASNSNIFGWKSASNNFHFVLARNFGNFVVTLGGGDYSASEVFYPGGGTAINAGTWYCFSMSANRRNHEIKWKINNGAVETVTGYYFPWVRMTSSPQFFIGGDGSIPANTVIDAVYYWKGRCITEAEMNTLYNSGNGYEYTA